MKNIITIDGPVGTGKSSVAWSVSKRLNYHYLNSGVIYRIAAYYVVNNIYTSNQISEIVDQLNNDSIEFVTHPKNSKDYMVLLNGEDITSKVTSESYGNLASQISQSKVLREGLIKKQRDFDHESGLVADGRDMGSKIFPEARIKIFLTARPEVRAKRRYQQLINKGIDANLEDICDDITNRDFNDMHRSVSPMVVPKGAYLIDSSENTFDEVVSQVIEVSEAMSGA